MAPGPLWLIPVRSWLVPGESDFVQLFWGVLTHSDMLASLLKTFAMPYMCPTRPFGFRAFLACPRAVLRL